MITILIIGAVIRMLRGPSHFLIPNIKARVEGLISDAERLARLNEAIERSDQASKELDKKIKGYSKHLNELTQRRGTSGVAFMALYSDALEAYKEVQETFVQGRSVFVQNLTPDEFAILTAPTATKTAEEEDLTQDSIEKASRNVRKDLDKVSQLAVEIISDPEPQQSVLSAVQDYERSLEEFLLEYGTWNYSNNEVLKNYQATEAQIQELVDRLNEHRFNVYTAFSDLYLRLSESCTDEEWRAAAKALKRTSEATG